MSLQIKESISKIHDKFMSEYVMLHQLCPKCGSEEFNSTLIERVWNFDNPDEFKDINICNCLKCGDMHQVHDRISLSDLREIKINKLI